MGIGVREFGFLVKPGTISAPILGQCPGMYWVPFFVPRNMGPSFKTFDDIFLLKNQNWKLIPKNVTHKKKSH